MSWHPLFSMKAIANETNGVHTKKELSECWRDYNDKKKCFKALLWVLYKVTHIKTLMFAWQLPLLLFSHFMLCAIILWCEKFTLLDGEKKGREKLSHIMLCYVWLRLFCVSLFFPLFTLFLPTRYHREKKKLSLYCAHTDDYVRIFHFTIYCVSFS